jgi:heptosyltransferase-2
VHQAAYYQHLVRELGVESGPLEPVLTVPDEAVTAARTVLTTRGWDASRALVAIAPGAAYGTAKRWLPEHYASLITQLVKTGLQCALVGSAGDTETTEWIIRLVPETERPYVIDLSGATTLSSLVGVIALAQAFVSNDSGAMHVASAVGVPVAAIFGPTREYETRPLPRAGARAEVLIHPVWCRPCMLRECPIDHRCMKGLSPERVFASVSELMGAMSRPAVFLDRDGTLIEERGFLDRLDRLAVFPGRAMPCACSSGQGLRRWSSPISPPLREASSTSRFCTRRTARSMRGWRLRAVRSTAIISVRTFPMRRWSEYRQTCRCRKPGPALIEQACREMDLDPAKSVMVGDRWIDVACGRAAGARAVLIRTVMVRTRPIRRATVSRADAILNNLMEAVGWILRSSSRS